MHRLACFVTIWKDKLTGLLRRKFQSQGGIVWYDVKNATDLWQSVDAVIGRILKALVFHEQQDWLEYDENIDLWMGYSVKKLGVKQRRTLITQWVGETYEKLRGPEYKKLTLRENCLYSKFFRSLFSRIWTEYGEILRISPSSVRMREITDRKNSEYGHFLPL